jgi:2-polyprenyl-3-methyl-5-hydroxy-6-metoxy-1,4-benzoquinol methylase
VTAVAEPVVPAEDMPAQMEAFAMRLLGSAVAMMDLATIRLGKDLGLYDVLVDSEALTPAQLAQRSGTDERYVREWLEQQAVTGILTVHHTAAAPPDRRYTLPPAHAEVLVNRASPAYLGALGSVTDMTAVLSALTDSFRNGRGVPWAQYGDGPRTMQAELNRPGYLTQLATQWVPAMPDIEQRLGSESGSRIADVGCGAGWSSIAFALAYPHVEVDGFDADDASIAEARRNAVESGVADRVRFEVRDAAAPGLPERSYDLVTAFECIHDLSQPVEALTAMRRLAAEDGFVVVADNAVEEAFTAPGSEIERLLYGSSVLVCLPTGRAHDHSAGTGAVMRPSTFTRYAQAAGFTSVDVAEVPHPFWTFYRPR